MDDEYPSWVVDSKVRVNCKDCTAECCKHVSIHIDKPITKEDFQTLADYLQHENIAVYKDDEGDWLVEFKTRCKQLEDNRCMAFKSNSQPMTCREYEMKTCVMNSSGDYWTVFFANAKDIAEYVKGKGMKIRTAPKNKCSSECCNHITIPIDEPDEWRDYDDIRWYITHKNVSAYKDDEGDWLVEFTTPRRENCKKCERDACKNDLHNYEIFFGTWGDIDAYLQKEGIQPSLKSGLKLTSY